MKKEYALVGLNCADCAAKIESAVKSQTGILSVSCSAISSSLVLEVESGYAEGITEKVKKIVGKYEPDVDVRAKGQENDDIESEGGKTRLIWISCGIILYTSALLSSGSKVQPYLYLAAYAILGWDIILKSLKNIFRGQVFNENFLMSIATIGAIILGDFPEAVTIMLLYQIGEYFQNAAVKKSRKSIAELMDLRPDYANVYFKGELTRVPPEDVVVGDIITVKPGEKIPLDGIVTEGETMLDMRALTGESVPRHARVSDVVISGCVNVSGVISVRVTKAYEESTAARIISLVENAGSRKAPTENFITTFSRYYTPAVVGLAALLAVIPPLFFGGVWAEWVHRALVFLVISCPCALVISVPLGFFGGIGHASRKGILVKGGNYLEALNRLEIVVFDKTGTLTKGVFNATQIEPAQGFTKEQLLEYAANAEALSNHPIALSVFKAYGKNINEKNLTDYEEILGCGVKAAASGDIILAGNSRLMEREGIGFTELEKAGTKVYVAVNGSYAGCIVISDELKADSFNTINSLKNNGVQKIVMLTGDNKEIAESVARDLSVDEVYAQLLPDEKVSIVDALNKKKSAKGKLAFVGDGINDAPVLALADVGVAMGGLGSDAAIEAADVVLMTDEPSKLIEAISIAKKTKRIVMQNIYFALGIKTLFLILGAFGVSGMWEAVFADVGVSILAVFNSLRAMR